MVERKKTMVLGASPNPVRFSHKAVKSLLRHNQEVVAVGFKEGLIGQKMDPDAYGRLAVDRSSEFVHEERIGKLKYLSAYVPFQNKDDEVLAYLNLPYFAKQNELENIVLDAEYVSLAVPAMR